ncbi:MAG: assimilatory sulfite reductase (NADPH) flavoprotein subunit [Pseudomarimonas sp.]
MPPQPAIRPTQSLDVVIPELLDGGRRQLLDQLVAGLDATALQWLSGYMAGVASGRSAPSAMPISKPAGVRLTVLYGSQTGNARRVAERIGRRASDAGLDVRVVATGDYARQELAAERLLVVVISTQGDGDPPEDSQGFVEFLGSRRAPALPALKYSVLALGDSSYPQFCVVGRKLDVRLAELGAQRFAERADADVEIDLVAAPWIDATLARVKEIAEPSPAVSATVTALRPSGSGWSRERPFAAELLENQRITSRDASKDVRHLEISLAGAGLSYQPGDALGVWPRNPASLVSQVLQTTGLDGEHLVEVGGRSLPLATWLTEERELTRLSRPLLLAHAERSLDSDLQHAVQNDSVRLLREYQPIDLLRRHAANWSAQDLVAALRPIAPRLYSIASSASVVGEEAHLTLARVDYPFDGIDHIGAASSHLADSVDGDRLRVFIEPNTRFRLPTDSSRDIIMIGAGTGVAPYRGFLQERIASAASGRNWLIFGERQARSSFLYQLEWQDALKRGGLQRIDLAFSRDNSGRDQAAKRYVQHAMADAGRELWAWIDAGATVYVCGDATAMAPDVHAALIQVVATHGGKSAEDATAFVSEMTDQRRYLRDVY